MGIYTNIQAALDTQLNTIPGSPEIAWPNTRYKPTQGTVYLEPILLSAPGELETLNDYHRYSGIYQVNILVPLEKGTATLNEWADAVRELFDGDKRLTAGGDTIFVLNIDKGPTFRDLDEEREVYKSNVDINFIVYS